MPLRRPAGARTPVDGSQSHESHQTLHSLPAYPYTLPLQPDLHPPRPVEGGLQVLPVHLTHQGQVLFRKPPWTGSRGWTGSPTAACTGALSATSDAPRSHHLPPPLQTHGPDLSAKKSRSTFSWPISLIQPGDQRGVALGLPFPTVAEDPGRALAQGFLPSLNLPRMDFVSSGQLGHRLLPLHRLQGLPSP